MIDFIDFDFGRNRKRLESYLEMTQDRANPFSTPSPAVSGTTDFMRTRLVTS